MADKVLEFIGSDSLPDAMRVNIQMEMPYDLAIKILDLIQKNMPEEASTAAAEDEATE